MKTPALKPSDLIARAMLAANKRSNELIAFASIGNPAINPAIRDACAHHAEMGAKLAIEMYSAELRAALIAKRPFDSGARLADLAGITTSELLRLRSATR